MRTALYTVALGAALLLTGTGSAGAQEGLFTSERDCTTDVKSLCAGVKPGGGRVLACLQSHIERTLRWLLVNSVEGHLDRAAMRRGHSSLLPQRHVRQRRRLHETASRRGQRDLQGSDGVHGLSRRRPILSSATSPEADRRASGVIVPAGHRPRDDVAGRIQTERSAALLEGACTSAIARNKEGSDLSSSNVTASAAAAVSFFAHISRGQRKSEEPAAATPIIYFPTGGK